MTTPSPHIHVIGTGGTIAARQTSAGGAVATDSVPELLATAGITIPVSSEEVVNIDSSRLTFQDLLHISQAVERACADPDVAGIVIPHGTDTTEETAFLLDLVHDSPVPVILTGAQKAADHPDTDGPRNLHEAALAAADPSMQGSGVTISFAGSIQGARGVAKMHTLAPAPFEGGLPVASVVGERVIRHHRISRRKALPRPTEALGKVRIDAVDASLGAHPDLLDAAVEYGSHGIVLVGTGVGNAPDGFVDAVRRATAADVPVVLSSRVPRGPVTPLYGGGGGVDLVEAGAILAGMLTTAQARVLLALLVSQGMTGEQLNATFTNYASGS